MKLEDKLLAYEDQQMTVGNDMDGALLIREARELIESLRAVARAAQEQLPNIGGSFQADEACWKIEQALDAVPAWVLESEE